MMIVLAWLGVSLLVGLIVYGVYLVAKLIIVSWHEGGKTVFLTLFIPAIVVFGVWGIYYLLAN